MTLFDEIQQGFETQVITLAEAEALFAQAELVDAHQEVEVYRTSDGRWLFRSPAGAALPCVKAEADGQGIVLCMPEGAELDTKTWFLLRTAFECRLCGQGVMSLHGACVEKDGQAVVFTGESGLGKSTRAMAWVDGLEAQFISGDRPAIRIGAHESQACGVPWDGKEQIFRNVEYPLKAIVEVRRSDTTYLRKLSAEQARNLLMRQSFVPMWDTGAAFMAVANARRLIRNTLVCRVFCGPDVDAAKAVYNVLFHHPEQIRKEEKDMKIKDGFVLRHVVDEFVVMPTGANIAAFDGAVVLNEVSAFVFEKLKNPISRADVLEAILAEYDVDEATAARDLDNLLDTLRGYDMLEEDMA